MRSRARPRRRWRHQVRYLAGWPRPRRPAQPGTVPGPAGNAGVRQSMDISDGDLIRLARDGDPAAFRLLVKRRLPMARARAARLCPRRTTPTMPCGRVLAAFIALDRLRDPDQFAGWLGGIVANVCRAQRRRAPLTLLGDSPENLHPASVHGLPSAEDLDRADALGRAVAGLSPGQRQAVPCSTTPTSPPARSPTLPAPPRPACTKPTAGCASTSPRTHRPHPRRVREDPHDCRPHRALDPWPKQRPVGRGARRRRRAPGAAGPAAQPRRVLAPARPPRRGRRPWTMPGR